MLSLINGMLLVKKSVHVMSSSAVLLLLKGRIDAGLDVKMMVSSASASASSSSSLHAVARLLLMLLQR